MLIQPVHPDHPSTAQKPHVTVGPELRGKAGAMPNRVRMMPPTIELFGSPDFGRHQRLSYSITMYENQVIYSF
jgi:hypothetical protein